MKRKGMLFGVIASLLASSVAFGAENVYQGSAQGRNGEIAVEVTIEDGQIKGIETTHAETEGLGDVAIETLTGAIVEGQDLTVDSVAGATLSSTGFLDAVKQAVEAAGLDPASFVGSGEEAAAAEDQTIDTEIVVIGGGGAGMAAAAAAAEAGAKVVVLDKMPNMGGNTRLGEGTYNMADAELLAATGAKTTPDLEAQVEEAVSAATDDPEYQALMDAVAEEFAAWKAEGTDVLFDTPNWHALQTYIGGGEIGDIALIRNYAEEAVPTFDWLVEDIGVPFKTDYIFLAIGGKWQRGHQVDLVAALGKEGDNGGSVYISRLQEKAASLGAEFYTGADVKEILTNEEGRTVGCVAECSDGSKLTVNASKAVILTTGGFAANSDLVYKYSNGSITTQLTSCAVSSTGDGIGLAEAVGADMVDLDQIQVHPLGDPINDCGCVAEFVGNWLGAQYYMFVNKEGERFVKEDGTRYEMSMAELEQTDGQMWLIVDSSQIAGDDSRTEQIQNLIASGHSFCGETVEDLAGQIGVDAAVLQATIDKYNEGMENGSDEFGKATSADSVIKVGPFYASLRTPTVHHTMGGVRINTEAQVLDANGEPIPGFYAAGEVTGGIHGNNRLGGNAYPDIMGYGKIAGENAAAE